MTEKGARFGRVHHHVLLRFNQRDLWDDTHAATRALVRWEDWKLGYGIAEIDEYDPKRGAAAYLTAYTIKQTYDWDLWVSR